MCATKAFSFCWQHLFAFLQLQYSNSARGCLSSDLAALKLHRLFNHNCLHTILHHTSRLCICILWHPPSVTSPGLTVYGFLTEGLFRGAAGSPVAITRLATSDPPLPLRLCFTADRRSARTPPARVIYDQQLLLQPMTHTAGCQMWSPCKQKLIWQPNISRRKAGQREGVGRRRGGPSGRKMEWQDGL